MGWFGRKPRRVGFGEDVSVAAPSRLRRAKARADATQKATAPAPITTKSSPWGEAPPPPPGRKRRNFLYFVFLLVPIMIFVTALTLAADSVRIVLTSEKVPVEVIAKKAYRESDGGTSYTPIFRWTDKDGSEIIATSDMRAKSFNFPKGTIVDVWVDHNSKTEVRVDQWFTLWGISSILGAVALGLRAFLRLLFPKR